MSRPVYGVKLMQVNYALRPRNGLQGSAGELAYHWAHSFQGVAAMSKSIYSFRKKQQTGYAKRVKTLTTRTLRCEHLEDRRLLAVVTVNTDQDIVDFSDSVTSLREAIYATNLVPGADEIIFDFGHDEPATIELSLGEIPITDDLTITGSGADLLTIDAVGNDSTPQQNNGDGSRIFVIASQSRFKNIATSIAGMTLTGGDVMSVGGAIFSSGVLALEDVVVTNNHAASDGGGLWLANQAKLERVAITNNSSGHDGGGIRVHSSTDVTIRDSAINGNIAADSGGGLAFSGRSLTIADSNISGNQSTLSGGGIQIDQSTVEITNTLVSRNKTTESDSSGGGISQYGGALLLKDARIVGNSANGEMSQGGGVAADSAVISFLNSEFSSNRATSEGGAVSSINTEMHIEGSEFRNNSVQFNGGAILIDGGTAHVRGTFFENNQAQTGNGGAISLTLSGEHTAQIEYSQFFNNTAEFAGGAIATTANSHLEISQSVFRNNQSRADDSTGLPTGGGAIFSSNSAQLSISESVLLDNQSQANGGAVHALGGLILQSTLIENNFAAADGGGAYVAANFRSTGTTAIVATTISRNYANGSAGGIYLMTSNRDIEIINSTISENEAVMGGGGIWIQGVGRGFNANYYLRHSTVAYNRDQSLEAGGGIFVNRNRLNLDHSILFGNESEGGPLDLATGGSGLVDVDYSLIGVVAPGTLLSANQLLLGIDPHLDPLSANGSRLELPNDNSRLLTHSLPPRSPAIDAGDPMLSAGVDGTPEFDQRWAPFSRVASGNAADPAVIDLGAFEVQPVSFGTFHGDFDDNQFVSGSDFLIWQRNFGTETGATPATGDATGDGDVDANDLDVWLSTYNQPNQAGPRPRRSIAAAVPPTTATSHVDLVFQSSVNNTQSTTKQGLAAIVSNTDDGYVVPEQLLENIVGSSAFRESPANSSPLNPIDAVNDESYENSFAEFADTAFESFGIL